MIEGKEGGKERSKEVKEVKERLKEVKEGKWRMEESSGCCSLFFLQE